MNTLLRSETFDRWLRKLRDARGKARILARLDAAALGNFGDCKSVGEGVMEMRIDVGPGYRVYYCRRGRAVYLLLLGGDKASQKKDMQSRHSDGARIGGLKMPARKRKTAYAAFDASDYLDDEETIAEYLAAALEDPNPNIFLRAVSNVAKARGIAEVAKAAGLGRESLYKTLAPGSKVRYETVCKLMQALGVKLTVTPA